VKKSPNLRPLLRADTNPPRERGNRASPRSRVGLVNTESLKPRLLRKPLPRFKQHCITKGRTPMSEGNGASFPAEIMELGDKIATLTIVKAVQLKDYLK
jgi:hypothetical protein